ncbi:MAG: ADOP family duplicated permease [Gemmatimonadales bacterium]
MPRRSWRPFGTRPDRDFAEEIRAHLELEADQLRAEGMSQAEANAQAHRAFGNVAHAQERFHESRRIRWLEELARDAAYALRQLRRAPALAAVIVCTLALGVGANSVIFGVVDALLLRAPSGIESPGQLRRLYFKGRSFLGPQGEAMYTTPVTSFATVTAMQRAPAFSGVAGVQHKTFAMGRGAGARPIEGEEVTGNYFEVLGVHAALGRVLVPADDRPPVGAPVVVLSYDFWQSEFGGSRDVIGKTLRIDDASVTVVGVAAPDFDGLDLTKVDVWIPASVMRASYGSRSLDRDWTSSPSSIWIRPVARLAPHATDSGAAASATLMYRRLIRDWRSEQYDNLPDSLSTVIPGSIIASRGPETPQEARVSLWLAGVASIVLLIACANVTNLLLARAFRRRREIAVRLALGVSRARLVRQLLTETFVLAAIATVVALLLATWGSGVLSALLLPGSLHHGSPFGGRLAAFTALAAFATALLAGTVPALQATRIDVARWLTTGDRDSGRQNRLQLGLLAAQVGLSVVLLVGAGLFVRSLQAVRGRDVGIDLSKVVLVQPALGESGLDSSRVRAILEQDLAIARRMPGVAHVSLAQHGVPKVSATSEPFGIAGRPPLPSLPTGGPYVNIIDDEYFPTLGTRILHGRGIERADMNAGSHVVVINEALARAYWPGESPIGACLVLDQYKGCTEVVGVVQDVMLWGLVGDSPGQFYLPRHSAVSTSSSALLVRTAGDASTVAPALRRALQNAAADVPYVDVESYANLVEPDLRSWRLGATMFGIFGALALVIAAVGLYAVLTYSVSQRTREIGVRLALGARRETIVRAVARREFACVILGIALGVIASLLTGNLAAPMLYETSPRDALVFGAVIASLVVVALAASVVPTLRASRVDPNVALRAE